MTACRFVHWVVLCLCCIKHANLNVFNHISHQLSISVNHTQCTFACACCRLFLKCTCMRIIIKQECGSSVVRALTSGARGPVSILTQARKIWCQNTLLFVSFAGITRTQCTVLPIRTFAGGPLCRDSHHPCRLKNPILVI